MFAFRTAFIFALITLASIMRVSAIVLPLNRYMLDVIPVGNPDGIADASTNVKPSHPTTPDADVPVADSSSPSTTDENETTTDAASKAANLASTEPTDAETPDSESASPDASSSGSADASAPAQTNGSSRVSLSSATVLVGSVVAGILLSA
ncbi:uncharacterized protein BXZ73DRAFT_100261 [Epithele typhae]|uniref:uncharacterized protein n=1 Tax=Epithele typhae TaxID=378194 RepID=UPI00200757EF|nr:uncharacterized protein BXZ73DRAFT_100261 [Epithele typhae]KAH9936842.1 hypothetical protein BXZ73DRAFT_100261 [Epithele typhae]